MRIPKQPKRIVSLVPSQTELLADLGLDGEVVGITKFCVHPTAWFRAKTRVGGTKKVDFNRVKALAPDLILANQEENTLEDVESLTAIAPVWVSKISDLPSALEMIHQLGSITARYAQAESLLQNINTGFQGLSKVARKQRIVYLIWKGPMMAAGSDTFIQDMISRLGFENAITKTRYPEITAEQLSSLNPDMVWLSSEPFPFHGKHTRELRERFPNLRFEEVDGEMFSWYGSRLLPATSYFTDLIKRLGA